LSQDSKEVPPARRRLAETAGPRPKRSSANRPTSGAWITQPPPVGQSAALRWHAGPLPQPPEKAAGNARRL